MSDETFNVELRFELEKTLEQLREAGRASEVLDEVLNALKQQFRDTEGAASSAGDAIDRALGSDLEDNTNRLRAAIEIIKTGFRELVESGRSLDEVSTAFKKLGDTELREFGKSFQVAIKAGADVAVRELREEFKQLDQQIKQSEQVAKAYSEVARKGFGDPAISARQFRDQVEQVKQKMLELQQTSGLALGDVVQGFRDANAVSGQFSSGVISRAASELRGMDDSASDLTTTMQGLDSISTVFFGTTLGQLALSVLRRVISQLDDLAERGVEVSRSFFNMGVSVRALQRLGIDVTMEEFEEQISHLTNTFEFFTERSIRSGISQMGLLIRNTKLSKEELFALSEAVGTIAITTGRDFEETAIAVGRAINSGYTEALQRAGIAVSIFDIQNAAAAEGIDKAFRAMTVEERAGVTLRIVLDQVSQVTGDVSEAQESLFGQVTEANTAIEEQADILGRRLTPAYVVFIKGISRAFEGLVALVGIVETAYLSFVASLIAGAVTIESVYRHIVEGTALSLDEIVEGHRNAFQEIEQILIDEYVLGVENIFADTEIGIPEAALSDAADELREQAEDLKEEIQDILADYQSGLVDASIDFLREGQDIELDFDRKTADEILEFQQDLEKLARQTADKISDKQDEFREKELKAERDFQEKLLRLREGFLFDLEDALRERDAKQVLRLIRQFNLRNTQLAREFENEKIERQEAFDDEIEDIQNQRERKRRELQIEFEERQAELELQRAREYEDRQTAYNREIEDLKRRRDERISELKQGLSAELQVWVDYWAGVLTIAQIGAVELQKIMQGIYGGFYGSGNRGQGSGTGTGVGGGGAVTFAEGGTLIARQPTVAIFGEKDAEVVSFSPLNRIGRDENKVFGGFLPGGKDDGGRMLIELLLSPDLEARIIDNTLGQVSDVLVRVMD